MENTFATNSGSNLHELIEGVDSVSVGRKNSEQKSGIISNSNSSEKFKLPSYEDLPTMTQLSDEINEEHDEDHILNKRVDFSPDGKYIIEDSNQTLTIIKKVVDPPLLSKIMMNITIFMKNRI